MEGPGARLAPPAPVVTVAVTKRRPSPCRAAIPSLHIVAAVICLILNIFLPGVGTIAAGFSLICCGNPGQSGGGKLGTFCLNFWVGVLQLLTCWVFLLGWIWSIMWGVAFIGLAADYHTPTETTTVITTGPATAETALNGHPVVVTQTEGHVGGADPPGFVPRAGDHLSYTEEIPGPAPGQKIAVAGRQQSNGALFTVTHGPAPVQ